ncbi:hypothetical protein BZG02_13340 [Labilibaculum filiforme]|uniref:DUF4397 domain-containing protein n=1 Tax=Labilibaculum filiforme TaxID=1940526 RepID=A0A2N3HW63_9BACT|nr:hypothetical protein [Labilibaculum filiforme]PKQ62292.1 hypothetical protein BZG02_13340 [Labilibaculum filiforme]
MKKITISLLALSLLAIVSACDTNDFEDPEFYGIGDVFVRCIKVGEETHYSPIFYASANEYLSEVSVESPVAGLPNYELSDYFEGKSVFRLLPEPSTYTSTNIANGIYKFTLTSAKQERLTIQDKLLDSRIEPIVISDFTYTKAGHTFDISWNQLENADTYVVKLMTEKDGKVLYISDRITTTKYQFNDNSKNWTYGVQLNAGTTYWIGVFGYEFESASTSNGSNINSETVEFKEIVW